MQKTSYRIVETGRLRFSVQYLYLNYHISEPFWATLEVFDDRIGAFVYLNALKRDPGLEGLSLDVNRVVHEEEF